ncbi:hypothetical protein FM101_12735 [Arthrobacter rhombi]|uniref:Uncharacterized protein n=1 Tax=Arthrobacter rhombi TaxID=71253 RepID=A0A1R4GSF7_9MICC|nr:hypothetical protein FM101_12735 [Arthrobacter rhombi]
MPRRHGETIRTLEALPPDEAGHETSEVQELPESEATAGDDD